VQPSSILDESQQALEKKIKTLVPAEVKTKIAKALTEQTTTCRTVSTRFRHGTG
jgi:hypothetical protein